MTRGEILVSLYEIGRASSMNHDNSFNLASTTFDNMYDNIEAVWYMAYFEFRKDYSQQASHDLADIYLGKVQELLDEVA